MASFNLSNNPWAKSKIGKSGTMNGESGMWSQEDNNAIFTPGGANAAANSGYRSGGDQTQHTPPSQREPDEMSRPNTPPPQQYASEQAPSPGRYPPQQQQQPSQPPTGMQTTPGGATYNPNPQAMHQPQTMQRPMDQRNDKQRLQRLAAMQQPQQQNVPMQQGQMPGQTGMAYQQAQARNAGMMGGQPPAGFLDAAGQTQMGGLGPPSLSKIVTPGAAGGGGQTAQPDPITPPNLGPQPGQVTFDQLPPNFLESYKNLPPDQQQAFLEQHNISDPQAGSNFGNLSQYEQQWHQGQLPSQQPGFGQQPPGGGQPLAKATGASSEWMTEHGYYTDASGQWFDPDGNPIDGPDDDEGGDFGTLKDRRERQRNTSQQSAIETMYRKLENEGDADKVNAYTQSILGLENLPVQQFYADKFPGAFEGLEGTQRTLKERMDPNAYEAHSLDFGGINPDGSVRQTNAFSVGASDQLSKAMGSATAMKAPDLTGLGVPGTVWDQGSNLVAEQGELDKLSTNLGLGTRTTSDISSSNTNMANVQDLINNYPGGTPMANMDPTLGGRPAFDESQYVTQTDRGPTMTPADLERMEADKAQFQRSGILPGQAPGNYLDTAMTNIGAMDPNDARFAATAKGENLSGRVGDANALSTDLTTAKNRVAGMGQSEFAEKALAQADSIVGDFSGTIDEADTTGLDSARAAMASRGTVGFDAAKSAMQADINEQYRMEELKLEESLAARGVSNSTMADEAREKLRSQKSRDLATSNMQALQMAGQESRADAGVMNQFANDEIQRAIASGDYERANKLAAQQGRTAQMGLNLQGAGTEDARREGQARMGIEQQTALGNEQRQNIGLSADIAAQEFDQVMRGKEFEQSQAQAQQGAQLAQGGMQMQGAGQQEGARQFDDTRGDSNRQFQIDAGLRAAGQQDQNAQFNQSTALQQQRLELDRSLGQAGLARQDIGMANDIIGQRFSQDMQSGQFDMERSAMQLQKDLAAAGIAREDIDRVAQIAQQQWQNTMARTGFDSSEQQRIVDAKNTALQLDENTYNQRAQLAMQPQSMMLSALAGTNVAPGVLGPMQMPLQQQPGGGWQGAVGSILGGAAGSFLGGAGTALGQRVI